MSADLEIGDIAPNAADSETFDPLASGFGLLADLYDGGSSPDYFYEYNGKLYFEAKTDNNGQELYVIDSDYNVNFIDIYEGSSSSSPRYFTGMGGHVYFRAQNSGNGYELWKNGWFFRRNRNGHGP